jgi:hypothetical protein
MDTFPDLSYTDRYQQRNKECISLGCDILPVLKGRSPMQAYSDFMRSFRDTFKDYLGPTVSVCILPWYLRTYLFKKSITEILLNINIKLYARKNM